MRTLAVEPPPMLDKEERRLKFINRNGILQFFETNSFANLNLLRHFMHCAGERNFCPIGYSTKLYTLRLRSEVQPLTLLNTILDS